MRKPICLIIAVICVLYYVAMFLYNTGFRISQQYLWLMIAAVVLLWGYLPELRLPVPLVRIADGIFWAGLALFLLVEGVIVFCMVQKPQKEPDYLIVLGAGLNGTVPSNSLQRRLNTTLEWLEEDPELVAIVTGGQGAGEDMTEALCMQQWLVERGIAAERIIMEDASTSTAENFRFGLPKMGTQKATVGVVTNHFHMFRSLCIAEKISRDLGMECEFEGVPAPFPSLLLPHFMAREFCTLVVDTLRGNLAWPF